MTPARRLDLVAGVAGVLFLAAAGLLLGGRPVRLEAAWAVPAILAGLAAWLVVGALRTRREEAAER
jgi:hypothetical protein